MNKMLAIIPIVIAVIGVGFVYAQTWECQRALDLADEALYKYNWPAASEVFLKVAEMHCGVNFLS